MDINHSEVNRLTKEMIKIIEGLVPTMMNDGRTLYDVEDVITAVQDNRQSPVEVMRRVLVGDLEPEFEEGRDYVVTKFLKTKKRYLKHEVRLFFTPIGIMRFCMAENARYRELNRKIGREFGFDATGHFVGKKQHWAS